MQTIATLLMFVLAVPLQRIETQYPDRAKVTRVETAMNHLTIIELAEPVTLAAAGSPSFKIERRDNKVFIQPLEEDFVVPTLDLEGRTAGRDRKSTRLNSSH